MLTISQDPRQCLLSWDNWQLQFSWQDDRWTHSLWMLEQGGRTPVWSSIEGTGEDLWPCSPAFQDLISERINDHCGEVQLLGQAGKNHYSAAIRCDGAANLIDFDLAVRIQSAPADPLQVGSYQQFGSKLGPANSVWRFSPEPIPLFPELTVVDQNQDGQTSDVPTTNLILSGLQSLKWDRHRATVRWKYTCRLTPLA
jgi:hypothetical protein